MRITNVNIGTRLGIAFGLVTLLVAVLGAISYRALDNVGDMWNSFSSISLQKRTLASQADSKLGDTIHHFKNYILRGQDYHKKFAADLNEIDTVVESYQKKPVSVREQALLDKISKGVSAYRLAMYQAIEMKKSGATIQEIDQSISGADKVIDEALMGLLDVARDEADATGRSLTDAVHRSEQLVVLLAAAVVGLSILCAWLVTRSIVAPMRQAVNIAQTVATGDLSSVIEVHSHDETGQLLQALKGMNESLVRIVGDVRGGADTIAAASKQIASGNLDLSSRTEEQASSLEETASSMEELTSTVKQNADNAHQANQLALSASEVAVKGGAVVTQVVATMGSINASAKKVVDIIGVIDGIAFQTNILALNAAVEAARAGAQGRGFAVVAAEVRNLAQRSAAAAKDIKTLIGNSVVQVDAGTKLVDQAGETMKEIVDSVKRVTDIMADISAASREQTAGIDQINQAITQMDGVTQQNAALVEEAAAAAESLNDQAGNLAQLMSVFKLGSAQSMHGAVHAVTRPSGEPHARARVVALPKMKSQRPGARVANTEQFKVAANMEVHHGEAWEKF